MGDNELILLAHLIGDGCVLARQPYHYTSKCSDNLTVVERIAEDLFNIKSRVVPQGNWSHVYLPSPYHLTHGVKHPITKWYDKLGLERQRSYAKKIPNAVFSCDNEKIVLFLHHLWATDGNISWKKQKGRKDTGAIYYASSSKTLSKQVQHLLLRLGVVSTVTKIKQGQYRPMYNVRIQANEMQLRFLKIIGCHGERGAIIPEMIASLEKIESNTNLDVIPAAVWPLLIKPSMKKSGHSQRSFSKQLNISHSGSMFKGNVSRNRLKNIGINLDDEKLIQLANSDVYWDEIISITPLGEQDVYDATVPGVHNFVANNIVVHNSIEQDADMVAFIYRPEYYQILEDEEGQSLKGVADVIIAKHRHGALKDIRLRFEGEFARFSNMDDPDFNDLPGVIGNITMPSKMNDDEDIPF